MSAHPNDEPTLEDQLERSSWVKWFGDTIRTCEPPYVFSVHGDWGAGKTSFLKQVHRYLRADLLDPSNGIQIAMKVWGAEWKVATDTVTIWFEAWRFQHEPVPVVALIQQMRSQLATHQKILREVSKVAEVTFYSLLGMLDKISTKIIGETAAEIAPRLSSIKKAGEAWESEHFDTPMISQSIREHLEKVIGQLVSEKARIVILIDDLDRCQPQAAYRLLEGIKIYLNLPNCVFVLAVDQRQLARAIAQCLPGADRVVADSGQPPPGAMLQARDYLEKICQDVWQLPLIPSGKQRDFFCTQLGDTPPHYAATLAKIREVMLEYPCLPANARKLKAYANTLRRFLQHCPTLADRDAEWQARMLIIMSSLYQFHTELYRRLEGSPGFYNDILNWLEKGRTPNRVFEDIEIAGSSPQGAAADPGSTRSPYVTYPDPATGNVFRIRRVVEKHGPVTEDEVKQYLLSHARA